MEVVSSHRVYLIPSSDYTMLKPPSRGAVFPYMTCSIMIGSLAIILNSNYRIDWLDEVTHYRTVQFQFRIFFSHLFFVIAKFFHYKKNE